MDRRNHGPGSEYGGLVPAPEPAGEARHAHLHLGNRRAGANTVVVETGAVPREMEEVRSEWRAFTLPEAKTLLADAGYDLPVSYNKLQKEKLMNRRRFLTLSVSGLISPTFLSLIHTESFAQPEKPIELRVGTS